MAAYSRERSSTASKAADLSATGNGDGAVTLGELDRFVSQEVSYQARLVHYRVQRPWFSGDRSMALLTLPEETTRSVMYLGRMAVLLGLMPAAAAGAVASPRSQHTVCHGFGGAAMARVR